MLRLLLQELRFRRNAIIGWGIGLSFVPILYVSLYPQFEDQLANMQDLLDLPIYQAMGMSFGTFEDWIASTVLTLIPVILAIYAVLDGTGTLAGEEDSGKLELVVTLPIPRWQIVTVKAIAHGIALFFILLIASLASTAVFLGIEDQIAQTTIGGSDVFMGLMAAWPVVFAIGLISLFFGTFCPSRRLAAILGTILVIASYFGQNITGQIESLEKFQPLFIFKYYDSSAQAFIEGQQTGDVLILAIVALLAYGLALFFFQRRNITVGAWPWQRAKIA